MEKFRDYMKSYDSKGRLNQAWKQMSTLGLIGKMEYWNEILSISKSVLFSWIRSVSKGER
jgi:hypothetical protein